MPCLTEGGTDVRSRRQIGSGPDRGQGQSRTLAEIIRKAAEGLCVTGAVTAEFCKSIVGDEQDFCVGHRGTEKAQG